MPSQATWRTPTPTPRGQTDGRAYRLLAALVGVLAAATALVWVLLWLAPPGPACLVLGVAGYEDNLAVHHNALGREAAARLGQFAGASRPLSVWFQSAGRLRLAHAADVKRGSDWARGLDDAREKTAIVFLALHGGADADGAYLLPHDATADEEDRLRLTAVIDRLADLPAWKHKLLILDATAADSDVSAGRLFNDFARGLEELDARIAAVPNLVVLSASGPDQRSWPAADRRTTLFGKHLVAALRTNGERLDAAGLFAQVRENVRRDAHRLYGARQEVVLLPRDGGADRAAHVSLTFRLEPDEEPAEAASPQPAIQSAWKDYHALGDRLAAARATSPAALRQWQAWLVRYEQLMLAGSPRSAEALARARDAADRVRAQTDPGLVSPADSLAGAALVGATDGGPPSPFPAFEELWGAKPAERGAAWERLRKAGVPRRHLLEAILARAADSPERNLATAVELIRLLDDPLRPARPAEAHFLVMLARDLPTGWSPELVRQALRLRVEAEKTALAVQSGSYAYAERVQDWTRDTIEQADLARQQGQDLLFATADRDLKQAGERLSAAGEKYRQAREDAEIVRAALAAVHRAWDELPAHFAWADADAAPLFDDVRRLERLVGEVPGVRDAGKLGEMKQSSEAVQAGLERLRSRLDLFARSCEGDRPGAGADSWRALRVPSLAPERRWALLRRQERLAQRERSIVEQVDMPTATQDSDDVKRQGARLGRLALASLGPAWFDGQEGERYDQVAHRLEQFGVEEHWWLSLRRAGDEIGRRARAIGIRMDASVKKALPEADRLARRLDAGQWAARPVDPANLLRRADLARLMVAQADRAWRDHWHGEGTTPYYRIVGGDYLRDAEALRPGIPMADARQRLARPSTLRIDAVGERHLLAGEEQTLAAAITLTAPETGGRGSRRAEAGAPVVAERSGEGVPDGSAGALPSRIGPDAGYPVLWAEPGEALALSGEIGRVVQPATLPEPARVTVGSPALDRAEQEPPDDAAPRRTALVWRGLYRGQRLERDATIWLHPVAESTRAEAGTPRGGAVAVRAPGDVLAKHGTVTGALSIVLDCSGSTGPAAGEAMTESTRYRQLVRALRRVLSRVPRGTAVSLWVFGQDTGDRRATAEDTVRRVQEPITWTGERRQLDEVMRQVEGLVPWHQSPIVRTMLRARDDLTRAEGARTLVVLTDGIDNRIDRDATFNPDKLPVPDLLLAQFKGSRIAVHVVGFQVADQEEAAAQRHYGVLSKLDPPGSFTTVNHIDDVVRSLDRVMRPDLHYRLAAPGFRSGEVGVAQVGENDRWLTVTDDDRTLYRLSVSAGWPLTQRLVLGGGDALLLELGGDARPSCRRLLFSRDPAHRLAPARQARDWRAAVLQNQALAGRRLQMLAALEKVPLADEPVIEQQVPRAVWLDLSTAATGAPAVRWGRLSGYPAPCYGIDAAGWPAVEGQFGRPRLRLWWSPDVEASYRSLTRPDHFRVLADLPRSIRLVGSPISIDSAAVERRWVQVAEGRREQRWCVVVRVSHATGEPVQVSLDGMATPAGVEHRWHTSANRYAGVFWYTGLDTREQLLDRVDSALSRVRIYSLGQLRREAEDRRFVADFDDLDAPAASPGRPRPVFVPR